MPQAPKPPKLPIETGWNCPMVVKSEEGDLRFRNFPAETPTKKETIFDKIKQSLTSGNVVVIVMIALFTLGVFWAKMNTESELKHIVARLEALEGKKKSLTEFDGTIGIITDKIVAKKSSFGAAYDHSDKICEFNEASNKWTVMPLYGQFFEVTNRQNRLKMPCMIIGSFVDKDNPNRLLIVSRNVAINLDFKVGTLSAAIKAIDESEVKGNKECLDLRNKYRTHLE